MKKPLKKSSYQSILSDIEALYVNARRTLVMTHWKIGERIVKAEQEGKEKAPYGKQLIKQLSKDLTAKFGNGFSESQLEKIRRFYIRNPISPQIAKLPWSHQLDLLAIKDPNRRKVLINKAVNRNLSREQLREMIHNEKISTEPELTNIKASKDVESGFKPLSTIRSRLFTYRILDPAYIHNETEEKVVDLGFTNNVQAEIFGITNLKPGEIIETKKAGNKYSFNRCDATAKELYTYVALVERVVDADSIWLNIDCGFKVWTRQKVRLRGIDAPELSTEEGIKVKEFVEARLKQVHFIVIKTHKNDKYDRYLTDIFYAEGEEEPQKVLEEGTFLNQELLDLGLAKMWDDE